MNDTMIEAMSQFEIPRPILRTRCRAGPCPTPDGVASARRAGSAVSLGTACNTLTVATALLRGEGGEARCGASGRDSVTTTLRAAMAGPQ